jgi:hypothetical protein
MSTAQQEEENARLAIELAGKLYKLVTDPEHAKTWEKVKPEERHQFLCKKYDSFARAFPVVMRFIARDCKYNEIAFRRMLTNQRLKREDRKGMDGYIEDQADYAMFLYIEETKKRGHKPNLKLAREIRAVEVNSMRKHMKKIKQKEKESKSEFEEEGKKHVEECKTELFDFIQTQAAAGVKPEFSDDEDELEPLDISNAVVPEPEQAPIKLTELNSADLSVEELPIMYKHLDEYYCELIDGLAEVNQRIRDLEEAAEKDKEDWLKGTVLEKKEVKAVETPSQSKGKQRRKKR